MIAVMKKAIDVIALDVNLLDLKIANKQLNTQLGLSFLNHKSKSFESYTFGSMKESSSQNKNFLFITAQIAILN